MKFDSDLFEIMENKEEERGLICVLFLHYLINHKISFCEKYIPEVTSKM